LIKINSNEADNFDVSGGINSVPRSKIDDKSRTISSQADIEKNLIMLNGLGLTKSKKKENTD